MKCRICGMGLADDDEWFSGQICCSIECYHELVKELEEARQDERERIFKELEKYHRDVAKGNKGAGYWSASQLLSLLMDYKEGLKQKLGGD